MLKKPCLKNHQKTDHLNRAERVISYGDIWLPIILSDEKKYNLDRQTDINFSSMI